MRLGDVAIVKWGDTSKTKAAYVDEGYTAYSASGPDGYLPYFDHAGLGIVLSAIGAQCGKTWLAKGQWSCIKNTMYIKANPDKCDTTFLYHLLQDENIWPKRGAAQPFISQSDAQKIELRLPPLPTQRKIAAILSAYDDLIENNTRRVRVLEEMARALYREWFVEYRFPGHEEAEFVEDELGRRPKGWEQGSFSNAAVVFSTSINPGNFPEEEFEHFSLPAFDEGQLPVVEPGAAIKSNKNRIPKDCVLLPKLNPRIPRVWLPPAPRSGRQIASTEFLPLLPSRGYSKYWLYALCSAPEFLEKLASMASGTSTSHQRISPKGLAILPLVLPPEEVVQRFTELGAPTLEMTSTLRLRNANLRRTRDLLLPRLVSGELDVSALNVRGPGLETGEEQAREEAVA